jgi:hypothetical protein
MLFFSLVVNPSLAADATGNWQVTITTADGVIAGVATLKQVGDEITGSLGPVEDPTITVGGVIEGNKLTLTTHPQPGRVVAFDRCYLMVAEDEMLGTIDRHGSTNNGTIKFVRTRR